MTKIGVLSDTHGTLPDEVFDFLVGSDEIWHAGDIGDYSVIEKLQKAGGFVRAVFGNIDGNDIRMIFPEVEIFQVEGANVILMHIGGTPSRYSPQALKLIKKYNPDIFVCGHSHFLKVQFDNKRKLLYLNPGAAGRSGFHNKITAIRFVIENGKAKDMEVLDLDR